MSDQCNDICSQVETEEELPEVEVDQEALVNILSRYPGPFDVLRELIQNADDAEAHNIEIHFETSETTESQPADETDTSKLSAWKWIIKNDGGSFQEKDWTRLSKIAHGNDNSSKVGAFGVGFYSVLSKSDRPLVKSNGKSLQFYRGEKDRKLRKRFIDCATDSWTSVELELRNPEPLPVPADLTRFLVSSVAFLANIQAFTIYLDGRRVLHIQKDMQPPVDVTIPQHLKPTTPSGALTMGSIQRTVQRIAIEGAEWTFTSSSASLSSADTADALHERAGRTEEARPKHTFRIGNVTLEDNAVTHDLYTAITSVNLDENSEMKTGVESSMKKLPSSFKCKAVYFNSEQTLAGISNSQSPRAKQVARLFCGSEGIFPDDDSGRLFIGQSTNQTTGIGLHVSAHFLPTVERGAIDLANGQVKVWNKEVLWMSGFLARVIYEEEMRIAANSKGDLAMQRGLGTMARFAFGATVPHAGVSLILQEAFFSCCYERKSPFPVVSDAGISSASDLNFRQRNKDLAFLKNYRVLHEEVEPNQQIQIITRYKIIPFKFGDIVREFESGVTQEAMRSFFSWWEEINRNPPLTSTSRNARDKFCTDFASRGILRLNDQVEIAFKNIEYFVFFPLPNDLFPPDTIQVDATSGVPTRSALECFGWTQLPLLHWLEYACSQARRSGQNSDAGSRILRVLVQFALVEELSPLRWVRVAELLEDINCVPTNKGLQLPANSYIEEADVCQSLPVVKEADFQNIPVTFVAFDRRFEPRYAESRHVRIVLARIRVRWMMDWEDMVGRLEAGASEETNYRLLQYFIIHFRQILTVERRMNDLQQKKIFFSENHGQASADELLLANEDVRKLKLPILALSRDAINSLQNICDQLGSFMVELFIQRFLGIQRYPTLEKIILLAASDKPDIRELALQYFLSNPEKQYDDYKADKFATIAFIPTKCGMLACPNEVFASGVWVQLGFKHVSEALRRDLSRLGIKDDPSIDTIVEYLRTPERTLPNLDTAKLWFEHLYLHGKLSSSELREQLSGVTFVPIENMDYSSSQSPPFTYISPKDCFIPSTETKRHHREIFPFVDFGQNGNRFLDSCCAKKSPDASDIVRKIVQNPQSYFAALGNNTKLYLDDLRTIASRLDSISEEDKQSMRKAPMFLAQRNGEDVRTLSLAEQVLISDWESREFGFDVLMAPKDEILGKMYREMGSVYLGKYVRHDVIPHKAEHHPPPFSREQVIRRIRCLMKERDKDGRTEVSFGDPDSLNELHVKACKNLTMQKIFAPPSAASVEGKRVHVRAGFQRDEDDESYTLWMVKGHKDAADLRKDIALALCHVLLKNYGLNDVFLLDSLFAMDDERLGEYYGNEAKSEIPGDDITEHKNKVKVEIALHPSVAKLLKVPKTTIWRMVTGSTVSAIEGTQKAIEMWCGSDPNSIPQDSSGSTQPHSSSSKKQNNKCKQVHPVMLKPKPELQDETTQIEFFMARDAHCQLPPKDALEEFARLISDLALVFGREDAASGCFMFWKDTDDDLMAFNRDRKYIFFNLANYYKFFYLERVERKQTIIDWYLIMAHEIAHMATMYHDEEHGSISSRLAVTYFPKLRKHFSDVSW